jgi:hypothetical protein
MISMLRRADRPILALAGEPLVAPDGDAMCHTEWVCAWWKGSGALENGVALRA